MSGPYSILHMTDEDLDQVYARLKEAAMLDMVPLREDIAASSVHAMRWAVDSTDTEFLWRMPLLRDDARYRYLFACKYGLIALRLGRYCHFTLIRASNSIEQRFAEIKPQIVAALRASGRMLDGQTDPANHNSFPHPQIFTEQGVQL